MVGGGRLGRAGFVLLLVMALRFLHSNVGDI